MTDMTRGEWSLHIGKDPDDATFWLCLVNNDEANAIYPLAQFENEEAMKAYTLFMETQGYLALKLPSQEELDKFFEE
jgi:hypothetical protein